MADVSSTNSSATYRSAAQAVAGDADSTAAAAVPALALIQQARLSAQNRAVNVAVATFGQTSTQATSASQTVAATTASAARLNVLGDQLGTPAPTVSSTGWALHGRVYDASLNPQTAYTVFLVDDQKNYASDYGYSFTDSTGYFLLNYAGTPAGGQAAAAGNLYLQVADSDANPVLQSDVAFTPTTGQATYQTITLAANTASLGDPPAAIRKLAMPPVDVKPAKTRKSTKKSDSDTTAT